MKRKRGIVSTITRNIKRQFKLKKIEIENIDSVLDHVVIKSVKEDNVSVSPSYDDSMADRSIYNAIDIKFYKLEKVFCNINASNFMTCDMKKMYIEEFPYIDRTQANYSSGFLDRHDESYGYVEKINKKNVLSFDRVLFLGGNGSFNFYHWMIELAPKLLYLDNILLKDNGINSILVNDTVEKNENFKWILKKCTAHLTDIEIIYINQSINLYVEELFFVNTFNLTVYNFNYFGEKYKNTTIFNIESLKLLKIKLANEAAAIERKQDKKFFILRNQDALSDYNKRNYNEDEIFSFFYEEGFRGICPDKLSLKEQIEIFKSADFIVGPSGAAWSNLIFSNASTKVISWLPKPLRYFDTYATLAYLNDLDMRFIEYSSVNGGIHGSYYLDPKLVKRLYRTMKNT